MIEIFRKINERGFFLTTQMSVFFLLVFVPTIQAQNSRSPIYTGSNVPGESKTGIDRLKNVYKYINIFRLKNGGNWPSKDEGLISDIVKNAKDYGFQNPRLAIDSLVNPDDKYNDSPVVRLNPSNRGIPAIYYLRPNGEKLGAVRKKGTSDVLAFSDTYFHFNEASVVTGRPLPNPVGFYLVLYGDGNIEKVAYDRQLYVCETGESKSSITYTYAFPRQAGIPNNTLSYEEYWDVVFGRKIFSFPPLGYRTPKGSALPVPDDGQAEGLLNLLRQWKPNIEREQIWGALDKGGENDFSLSKLTSITEQLGLNTQIQKLSLNELQQKGVSALTLLPDDGRIITVLAIGTQFVVVIDRGRTFIFELAKLQERLGSQQFEALLPTKALTQNAAIIANDAVRELKLPSLDAEVPQQFVLRNTGTTPITLQLEYPLLGVTESKLSRDTIPPGETATLDLKVKWRSILKAPYQNVLVSIQTNDPVVPRLQLAILLTPPATANAK